MSSNDSFFLDRRIDSVEKECKKRIEAYEYWSNQAKDALNRYLMLKNELDSLKMRRAEENLLLEKYWNTPPSRHE